MNSLNIILTDNPTQEDIKKAVEEDKLVIAFVMEDEKYRGDFKNDRQREACMKEWGIEAEPDGLDRVNIVIVNKCLDKEKFKEAYLSQMEEVEKVLRKNLKESLLGSPVNKEAKQKAHGIIKRTISRIRRRAHG